MLTTHKLATSLSGTETKVFMFVHPARRDVKRRRAFGIGRQCVHDESAGREPSVTIRLRQ
jgi:hypothetical protein